MMASVPTGPANEGLPQLPESKNAPDTNRREHNADSYEYIQDPVQGVDLVPSEDDLCASCSEFHSKCSVLPEDRTLFLGTSTVGTILSNKKCPSCRLVAYCIHNLVEAKPIPLESKISLFPFLYYFEKLPGSRCTHIKNDLLKHVEIRLNTRKPKNDEEVEMDDRDIIGVLLPFTNDKINDRTGLVEQSALCNTLENNGPGYALPVTCKVDVKCLRAWIDFCTDSHSFCRTKKTLNNANTELRLIDVVERCLIDATLVEEYIALSYVWGPNNNKVLTKSTLGNIQQKGSLNSSTVPRLVADIMDFIAEIGERYLWVDAMCIIQDDPSDKQRQLPNMYSIYTHAKFTVIATVESANDPLPRWKKCHHRLSGPTAFIQGLNYIVRPPPLAAALAQTIWNTRGWTFQEAFLTKRLLVFTKNVVYWSCREVSWREDQYTVFQNVKDKLIPQTSLFAPRFWSTTCDGKETVISQLCPMGLYAKHAEMYSQRLFTYSSDVIWAFLGILDAKKEHFPSGYIWGLPYDQLDAALLWFPCCERIQCAEHQYSFSPKKLFPIPSWCWIGKGHGVWFMYRICMTKSRVTWHEPIKCWPSNTKSTSEDQGILRHPQASVLNDSPSKSDESVIHDYAFLRFTAQTAMLFIELDSASFNLKKFTNYIKTQQADLDSHPLVVANIYLFSKRAIGQISVPAYIFRNSTYQLREFVLLSELTIEIQNQAWNNDTNHAKRPGSGASYYHNRGEDRTGILHQEENTCKNEHDQAQEFDNMMQNHEKTHLEGCPHRPALNVMLIEWDDTHTIKNFARRVGIARIDFSAWEEVETTEKTIVLG